MKTLDPVRQHRLTAAILRTDFYSFVQAAFPLISPGDQFRPNWHIEAMAYELDLVRQGVNRRLIINVPPRNLKSICASVALPAYVLGHFPTKRIICVSYSENLARKLGSDCRALMGSDFYRRLFPNTSIGSGRDSELEFVTTAGGSRLATSVGGTLTGRGGDLIIVDDPINAINAMSQSFRTSTNQWFTNTLLSRLNNMTTGVIVVVMQRLHMDDLSGYLLTPPTDWRHVKLPAIAAREEWYRLGDEHDFCRLPGNVLHPAHQPQEVLDNLRRDMGSSTFSAQYQQEPVPAGGNLIKWAWFRFHDRRPRADINDRIVVSWDTALSAQELASYSACVVLLIKNDSVYVLDVIRERLEYPDLKRRVVAVHQCWKSVTRDYQLLIENKGSGMCLIQDLRRDHIQPIAIQPIGDKIMRMTQQTARVESGAVSLPQQAPWLDTFRDELSAFPQGAHSDQVDAFSQALNHTFNRRGGEYSVGYVRGMN